MKRNPTKSWRLWLFYLAFGAGVLALLVSAMRDTIASAPSRDAVADLGDYGLVTIRFSTDPNPPLPTGTVLLSFSPTDVRRRPFALDQLRYEYGQEGSSQAVGSGQAEPMGDGSEVLMGRAQFPEVGRWWLRLQLQKGDSWDEVRFTLYVEPAQ